MIVEHEEHVDLDLDAVPLTDAQRSALAIDRHLVVSAGAGSGKTHTLSWRYVRLLLKLAQEGARTPEGVLVLTFTEKAAHEMAQRCERRLIELGHPVLAPLIESFQRASIQTFHAFCARITREFPGWTGVPADARVLEPDEATRLRRELGARAFDRWLDERTADVGLLLDTFGSRRGVLEAIDQALARHGVLRERLALHASGQLLDPGPVDATWATWLVKTGLPTLRAVRQLTRPGGSRASAALDPLCTDPPEGLALHRRVQEVLGALVNDRGVLRQLHHPSLLGAKREWRDLRRYAQAKAALQVLAERCADWPDRLLEAQLLPTPADALLLQALQPFAQLVQQTHATHVRTLQERRLVDFDRMLDAAVDAVQDVPELRRLLRERHRYLMVDEFQDTDPRQWQMVRLLGDPEPGEAPDRVFLVGDVKQAIYGFRGGEVRLFHEAAAHLGVEPLVLPDNFRTLPPVIDWFNQMLPRVLTDDWEPIRPGRAGSGGRVRWLEAEDLEAQTEQLVALLQEPDLGQVAVLLRTRTYLGTWEAALKRAGIAYEVAKGVGFWERDEVREVGNLVHALVTGELLSWVGVWRSPWFGASEQQVHDAVLAGTLTPAMQALQELADSLVATPLLAVVEAALAPAWPWWSPQARANVERLLERIEAWDEGPSVVAQRLHEALLEGPREGEAPSAASEARVVLLTVHASKGLEFDTVVLPELQRPVRSRPDALAVAHVDDAWVMAASVDDTEAELQGRARPGLLNRVRRQLQTEAAAEADRLLYVAMTRVRDQLVLIGPREGPSGSWADRLPDPPRSTSFEQLAPVEVSTAPSARTWTVPPLHPGQPAREVAITASDVSAAAVCTVQWFLARDALPSPPTVASVAGSVLHAAIEDRLFDPEAVATRWRTASVGLPAEDRRRGWDRVRTSLARLARDPTLEELLALPGFDEIAVRTPFPGGWFVGRIDRLFVDRERGGFVVLDYKTGREDPAHRAQIDAYAWAAQHVLEAHGQPDVVGGLLYFTGDGSTVSLATDPSWVEPRLTELAAIETFEDAWEHVPAEPPCATCPFLGASCPGMLR